MAVSLVFGGTVAVFVCLVMVAVKLAQFFTDLNRRKKLLADVPSMPHSRIWGHLLEYPGPNDAGLAWQRKMLGFFPRFSLLWLGPFIPLVLVSHPETLRLILKTTEPKGMIYRFIKPWVGDGLLLSKGKKWARNRRLLTPAFHFDILKPYMLVNNQAADIFLNKIERFSRYDEYFELFQEVSMYTLDVILRCAFTYKTDCQNLGDQHPYVQAVNKLSTLSTDRFFKPWVHNDFLYSLTPNGRWLKKNSDFVHQVASEIIEKRKETLGPELKAEVISRKYRDFLDILLTAQDEDGEGLSDSEIRDEVDTFLFEGHDTTASAICWTLCSLAEHPEHQRVIQQELDNILKDRPSDEILWEDLPKMSYLTMCIKEALRLHTPVPYIQRQLTQDMVIDGVRIPPGTLINVVIYNIHHNPTVWENSTEYLPVRFCPENIDSHDPYAFIPFSAGPRNYIGQNFAMHENKVMIARILDRYTLQLDPDTKVEKRMEMVMRSQHGIKVKAIPRQK